MNLFDLFATINLNTDGYDAGIAGAVDGANEAEEALEAIDTDTVEEGLDELGETADETGEAFDDLGSSADDTGDDLDDLGSEADDTSGDLSELGSAADDAAGDIDDLGSSADDAGGDLDDLSSSADDAGGSLDDLGSSADDAAGSLDDFSDSADNAATSAGDLGSSASDSIDSVGELGSALGGTVVSGSSDAASALSGVEGIISGFATGGLIGGAVNAIGTVGKGIYNLATEGQRSSAIIAQGTGATGDALEDMEKRAKHALNSVSLSSETNLTEVSGTLSELNTRFGLTGDDLETVTTQMTDFATITGQDGVTAVDNVANAMNAWQMSADEMPGLLDDLTTASQNSGIGAGELESALSKNSAAFQQLGFDVDDSLAFLSAYGGATGSASDVTGLLKTAVNTLTGNVEDVPGTFNDAIEAIQSADSASDALTATVGDTGLTVQDVFGTKNANKLITAVQSEQFSIDDMTAALSENSGVMNQTTSDSSTFTDTIQSGFNTIKTVASDACGTVSETIGGLGDDMSNVGAGIADGLDAGADQANESAVGIANTVVDGVNGTLGINSPSTVMMESGQNVVEGFTTGLAGMPDSIGSVLTSVLGNITTFGTSAVSKIGSSALNAVSSAATNFSNLPGKIGTNLTGALSQITTWGTNIASKATSSASKFVTNIGSGLSGIVGKVTGKLSSVTSYVSGWGTTLSSSFRTIGVNAINGIINGIGSMVSKLYSSIKNALSGLVNKAKNALGINSPSTIFRDEVGIQIPAGVAEGVEKGTGVMEDAVDDMLDDIADVPGISVGASTLSYDTADAKGGFETQLEAFNDKIDILLNLIYQYFPQFAASQPVVYTDQAVAALGPKMTKYVQSNIGSTQQSYRRSKGV